jgi:hypothetical protein
VTFFSGGNIRLYYCNVLANKADLPSTQVWKEFPFTAEAFVTRPSFYGDSLLSSTGYEPKQGRTWSVTSGGITQEFSICSPFLDCLRQFFKSSITSLFSGVDTEDNIPEVFAFLKIVDRGDKVDYYLYRHCRPSSIVLSIATGWIQTEIEFSVAFLGNLSQDVPHYLDQTPGSEDTAIAGWTYGSFGDYEPQTIHGLTAFSISSSGSQLDVLPDSIVLSFTKDVAGDPVLNGKDHYIVPTLSNVKATLVSNVYYTDPSLINVIRSKTDCSLTMTFSSDAHDNDLSIAFPYAQLLDYTEPTASSPEQTLTTSLILSAYSSGNDFVTISVSEPT